MDILFRVLSLIPSLISTIRAIEEAIPMSGKGKEKAEMIIGIVAATGEGLKELIPTIRTVISVIVNTLNAVGVFKKGE